MALETYDVTAIERFSVGPAASALLSALMAVVLLGLVAKPAAAETNQRGSVDASPEVAASVTPRNALSPQAPDIGPRQTSIRQVTRPFDFTRLTAVSVADWEEPTTAK